MGEGLPAARAALPLVADAFNDENPSGIKLAWVVIMKWRKSFNLYASVKTQCNRLLLARTLQECIAA
jgi:hypothetical protein